jgi:hypothetical protein
LSKVYNDFGHLAFGLDQAPKMITKLYEYNQKIPGFVMKDIINKEDFERLMRKNLIHDFASFNHFFRDDKELALTVIGHDVNAFKVLSNKLKNDPELYNHVPMNLLPIKARSDSTYMLGRENWLYPHIDNASKSLVADLDYLINCFVATGGYEYADDEDYQRQYTTANLQVAKKFPKSFIEELREIGEDPRIWGYAIPENYIGPPEGGTIINSKGELAFKQTHIKLNLKILCKIKKLRFNKKIQAELSSKETAPKRKNKI